MTSPPFWIVSEPGNCSPTVNVPARLSVPPVSTTMPGRRLKDRRRDHRVPAGQRAVGDRQQRIIHQRDCPPTMMDGLKVSVVVSVYVWPLRSKMT